MAENFSQNRSDLGHDVLVRVESLEKRYGLKHVFSGVSFRVRGGEILGLAGVNGAGKTTLLKLLARLSRPTSGKIFINGENIWSSSKDILPRIGYLGHSSGLYHDLTARENLHFFGKALRIDAYTEKSIEMLEKVGIADRMDFPLKYFSRGLLQRCAVARLMLQNPLVLLLDEPFTGLDQEGQVFLEDFILSCIKNGKAVILVSHNMERLWKLSTVFGILEEGQYLSPGDKSAISLVALQELQSGKLGNQHKIYNQVK